MKSNKLIFLLIFISIFLNSCGGGGKAKVGSIEGYVYESISSSPSQSKIKISKLSSAPTGYLPLVGATVSVSGVNTIATTNQDGYYKLDNIPEGSQTVTIVKEGYTPMQVQVNVISGQTIQVQSGIENGAVIQPKDNYFELANGNSWTYAITHTITTYNTQGQLTNQSTGTGTVTDTITGTQVVSNTTTNILNVSGEVTWDNGNKDTILEKYYLYWATSELLNYAQEINGDYTENLTPEKILVLPLSENSTWTTSGLLYHARPQALKLLFKKYKNAGAFVYTHKVIGKESVSISAGVFNCFKIDITSQDTDYEEVEWYAPIGLVKKQMTIKNIPVMDEQGNIIGYMNDEEVMELKDYELKVAS